MTTDHNLIAQACRLARLEEMSSHLPGPPDAYVVEFDDGRNWCGMSPDNPALHALLVWRLVKTLAARPYVWHEDDTEQAPIEMWTNGEVWNISRQTDCCTFDIGSAGELEEPIDIIRVLVDALEGER